MQRSARQWLRGKPHSRNVDRSASHSDSAPRALRFLAFPAGAAQPTGPGFACKVRAGEMSFKPGLVMMREKAALQSTCTCSSDGSWLPRLIVAVFHTDFPLKGSGLGREYNLSLYYPYDHWSFRGGLQMSEGHSFPDWRHRCVWCYYWSVVDGLGALLLHFVVLQLAFEPLLLDLLDFPVSLFDVFNPVSHWPGYGNSIWCRVSPVSWVKLASHWWPIDHICVGVPVHVDLSIVPE